MACGRSAMTLHENKYRIESTRLPGWDYRTPGWYFVTICVREHAELLGKVTEGTIHLSAAGEIASSDLRSLPEHYNEISVDCLIVMPNHVHAIFEIDGAHRFSPNPGGTDRFGWRRATVSSTQSWIALRGSPLAQSRSNATLS